MDQPLLDLLIETAQLHLERLQALPRGETAEELIAIQQERRLRVIAEQKRGYWQLRPTIREPCVISQIPLTS